MTAQLHQADSDEVGIIIDTPSRRIAVSGNDDRQVVLTAQVNGVTVRVELEQLECKLLWQAMQTEAVRSARRWDRSSARLEAAEAISKAQREAS